VRRRSVLLFVVALAGFGAWYAFRPERAVLDRRVSDAPPPADAVTVRQGEFRSLAHEGRGRAELLRTADGRLLLRLSGFESSDGPDLRVYLVGRAGLETNAEVAEAGVVDLGALRGNIGDQTYEVPVDTDLARLTVVSIWCRRFGVNFMEAETIATM